MGLGDGMIRFALVLMLAGSAVRADEVPWTLDCSEVIHSELSVDTGDIQVRKDRDFQLTFSRIDGDEWVMTGNVGTVPLVTIAGRGVIQFIEQTQWGTLNLTQVSLNDVGGIFRAIHSRHTIIAGEMAPSQWLLACKRR